MLGPQKTSHGMLTKKGSVSSLTLKSLCLAWQMLCPVILWSWLSTCTLVKWNFVWKQSSRTRPTKWSVTSMFSLASLYFYPYLSFLISSFDLFFVRSIWAAVCHLYPSPLPLCVCVCELEPMHHRTIVINCMCTYYPRNKTVMIGSVNWSSLFWWRIFESVGLAVMLIAASRAGS